MSNPDKALETQLKNIETKTGKSLPELFKLIEKSSLTKHGELRDMVREKFDLGYGDANTLIHLARNPNLQKGSSADAGTVEDALGEIYTGNKEGLRPLHDAVMKRIHKLGEFEIAPKKKYLSLRRKKQFAMVGPASKGRIEVGLNMRDVKGTSRLESLPPGGMCQYRVYLEQSEEVDDELLGWIKNAYEAAG